MIALQPQQCLRSSSFIDLGYRGGTDEVRLAPVKKAVMSAMLIFAIQMETNLCIL